MILRQLSKKKRSFFSTGIPLLLMLVLLIILSLVNFLLFHSFAEIFSIIIACTIFIIAWNTRTYAENHYLLFLGTALLFICAIDLIHTLAYKGMGVFPRYGPNLPTQLWIVARFLEAVSLLAVPFILKKKIKLPILFSGFFAITATAVVLIFLRIFPSCFIEGEGLTLFKKIAEYTIVAVLGTAIFFLTRKRHYLPRPIFIWFLASIITTIISELAFTFYISVYGISNIIGHYLKVISFYFIYRANIATSLSKPFSLFFKQLTEKQDLLEKSVADKEMLLQEIHHRVKNNLHVISGLLMLQLETVKGNEARKVLEETHTRIGSMAAVYDRLYNTKNYAAVNLRVYFEELIKGITKSITDTRIQIEVKTEDIEIATEKAIPIGIILNELVTNSVKHAFPKKGKGNVFVFLQKVPEGGCVLTVSDNGKGLPDDFDLHAAESFGLNIVKTLVDQLGGELGVETGEVTSFSLRFHTEE